VNTLAQILAQRIRDYGPISVADYMAAASDRYYATHDPFGPRGDFVTAPEVSQMFGELIGLSCAVTWRAMGAPARLMLVELGPGRGTLMRDALHAATLMPDFLAAVELHLVETSAALREAQQAALAAYGPQWHATAEELPDGPMLLIANEFFDALPVRQFVRATEGWRERLVGLSGDDFAFVLGTEAADIPAAAMPGTVREVSPAAIDLAARLGRRIAMQGGAALLIDYGYGEGTGDTVQALRGHRRHDVLRDPGEADITAHVDFAAIAAAAASAGARIDGPTAQGDFLRRLGIEARAERLLASASPEEAATVAAGLRRLIDPDAMGRLFKVMAIADPALPPFPGFDKETP
jgi:NADH dehydrogenase [ubiquinone] 1 alpha subcomplex assembly factor 7